MAVVVLVEKVTLKDMQQARTDFGSGGKSSSSCDYGRYASLSPLDECDELAESMMCLVGQILETILPWNAQKMREGPWQSEHEDVLVRGCYLTRRDQAC